MIRVGFTIIGGKTNWMGGINYLKNLLYAIKQIPNSQIEPVLFLGKKVPQSLINEFSSLAIIEQSSIFDRYSFEWFIDIIFRDILGKNILINRVIKKHNIHIFSHSFIHGKDLNCVSINWVPDFQHLRLPHLFSKLNLKVRNYRLRTMIENSNHIILSSNDAFNDFQFFSQKNANKTSVLHFVSQSTSFSDKSISYLEDKYNFKHPYYFLPNQFWAHKDHLTAFRAIQNAVISCPDILLICTGQMMDNRNKDFINNIVGFVEQNNLKNNIKLLGIIPFQDVLLFMKHCKAVINPSRFEGWSSTVEEAKSSGKNMILSDIAVHLEQASDDASFFQTGDFISLSKLLCYHWENDFIKRDSNYSEDLQKRTIVFGTEFEAIIKQSLDRL